MEISELATSEHKIAEFKDQSTDSRAGHMFMVKHILESLRKKNPVFVYPSDEAMDYLVANVPETRTMVFNFVTDSENPVAAIVGLENGKNLDLRWVFSSQSGAGIELIKQLMNKYEGIKIKASPFGCTKDDQETQLSKLVNYYKKLGFNETSDYKDIKYGGTIPMEWHKS